MNKAIRRLVLAIHWVTLNLCCYLVFAVFYVY